MTMITPSYLGETIEYSSLHACRSTLEDPTRDPLGICAWRSVAHRILVRVELPFILHWFKYRLPAITNPAGRLSIWMLGKRHGLGKWASAKSWQAACYESNRQFTNGLAMREIS